MQQTETTLATLHQLRLCTRIDWSPFVIMGQAMPPRDPDEEDEDEEDDDEEDDSTDEPPVVREPDKE